MISRKNRVTSMWKDLTLALFSFNSGCFVLHTYTGTVCYGRKGFLVDTATRSYFASFPQDTIHNIRCGEQHTSRENMQVRILLFMRESPFNPFRLFLTGQSHSLSFLLLKKLKQTCYLCFWGPVFQCLSSSKTLLYRIGSFNFTRGCEKQFLLRVFSVDHGNLVCQF